MDYDNDAKACLEDWQDLTKDYKELEVSTKYFWYKKSNKKISREIFRNKIKIRWKKLAFFGMNNYKNQMFLIFGEQMLLAWLSAS